MIDREHDQPIAKQAAILRISRGSVYDLPRPVSEVDLVIMRLTGSGAAFRRLADVEKSLAAKACKIGRRQADGDGGSLSPSAHHQARRVPQGPSAFAAVRGERSCTDFGSARA
jgi:hypothetical protein